MIGVGAIIKTKKITTIPDIPTGIILQSVSNALPDIPTNLNAVYAINIPSEINLTTL